MRKQLTKSFRYKGAKVKIISYSDTWERLVRIEKGKQVKVFPINRKHLSDAVEEIKSEIAGMGGKKN